ncbi:MAG: sulfotransferase [Gemmatimonadaceae bacterium]
MSTISTKQLFIIGCPRSGTTWAGLLLAQHPQISVCQQLGVVSAMNHVRKWWLGGEGRDENRFISSIVRFGPDDDTPRFEQLLTREEMHGVCRGIAERTYRRAAEDKADCRVVVDKTPENVRNTDVMLEVMPDAYFLHLIRDPRSVFASHRHGSKDFGALFPSDPEGSATYWAADVRGGRELGKQTANYRELRYESMKTNGREELIGIIEWLGLTADPEWCDLVLAKTSVEKLQKSKGTPSSFFRSGKAEGWREELTTHELHVVEYHARDLMHSLGYDCALPNSDRPSLRMKMGGARKTFVTYGRNAMKVMRKRARG